MTEIPTRYEEALAKTPAGAAGDAPPELDWNMVTALAWRPAWSIRSRRGSLAPFLDLLAGLLKSRK